VTNNEEGCQSFEEWLIQLAPTLLFGKPPVPNGKQEEEEAEDIEESTLEATRLFEWIPQQQALA
jgi:hypothetical protein